MMLFRLFLLPLLVTAGGPVIGILIASAASSFQGPYQPIGDLFFQIGEGVAFVGLGVGCLWMAYRGYMLYRWQAGHMDGDCLNCGGVMMHLDGRYGPYRKCYMCGVKREGHF